MDLLGGHFLQLQVPSVAQQSLDGPQQQAEGECRGLVRLFSLFPLTLFNPSFHGAAVQLGLVVGSTAGLCGVEITKLKCWCWGLTLITAAWAVWALTGLAGALGDTATIYAELRLFWKTFRRKYSPFWRGIFGSWLEIAWHELTEKGDLSKVYIGLDHSTDHM